MTDEELMEQGLNCPTMYFDGFGAFRKQNGVLRSIGYIISTGAQLNLIVSLTGAEMANREGRRALDQMPNRKTDWRPGELAH